MWPFKPRPTRSSARPPVRPSARPANFHHARLPQSAHPLDHRTPRLSVRPVHPTAALPPPTAQSARPLVRPTRRPRNGGLDRPVRPSTRPCVLGPVRASSAHPRVRALSAPSARPLDCTHPFHPRPPDRPCPFRPVRLSARPLVRLVSAHPPVRFVHASSATSASPIRHIRSARVRQPLLYIPHPASPQIIQLLAVRVGPRVFVAPLRTATLRRAQGLQEVGVNCRGNPCNLFFLRSKQHGEEKHLHPGRPGYNNS